MMKNRWIQYAIGIFIGVSIYRLIGKHETWIQSLLIAGLLAIAITLVMYFHSKWKTKKSA